MQATNDAPLTLTQLFGSSDPTAIRCCLEPGRLDREADPAQAPGEGVRV